VTEEEGKRNELRKKKHENCDDVKVIKSESSCGVNHLVIMEMRGNI
jgi:hypothetical protein